MVPGPMSAPGGTPSAVLRSLLPEAVLALAEPLLATLTADRTQLPVLFPSLPRRAGREAIGSGRSRVGAATIDRGAFRTCDVLAAWLLAALPADDHERIDLYDHGDLEERAMLLRALHFLPVGPLTVRLYGEVQRTNVVLHLEAALCDGDLFVRTLGQPGFDTTAANKLLLKLAFLDLPLQRAFGAERAANPELSRMLQDLATEREAAGRAVWRDTARLIGRAPTAGTTARLVGGLEHGDDHVRLAAAEGLAALALGPANRPELRPLVQERLERETRPAIRAALQRCLEAFTPPSH
jgi:hypothetical protein